MAKLNPSLAILLLAACAIFFAGVNPSEGRQPRTPPAAEGTFANGLADGGCLRIKHSPSAGINVTVVMTIDGQLAGAFTKGHVYQRFLTPGRHAIAVSRNGRDIDTWFGNLDVQRGQTYSFVVKYNASGMFLVPTAEVH
ncbi:MAG: hypothetical protein ACJ8M4_02265 [Chthoniobacterales bacterium]